MIWSVINKFDGNYTFEVEADTREDACLIALGEVGWCVSFDPQEPEEQDALEESHEL